MIEGLPLVLEEYPRPSTPSAENPVQWKEVAVAAKKVKFAVRPEIVTSSEYPGPVI